MRHTYRHNNQNSTICFICLDMGKSLSTPSNGRLGIRRISWISTILGHFRVKREILEYLFVILESRNNYPKYLDI